MKWNSNKKKQQPTEWEKIFNSTSDRGLIPKTHKEFKKLDINKLNNPIKKKKKNRYKAKQRLINRGIQMAKKHKEMFNILGYQGDANEKNNQI